MRNAIFSNISKIIEREQIEITVEPKNTYFITAFITTNKNAAVVT